jgi:hypothetical protein
MMMDDECGTMDGMIGRRNQSTLRKPAQFRFGHHKSNMTIPGLESGPPRREASV